MNPLPLAPLPTLRVNDPPHTPNSEMEGFVDDDAVLALLKKPAAVRSEAYPEDLALSSTDDDFAGWAMPRVASPFRAMAEKGAGAALTDSAAVYRRPQPPRWEEEPGLGLAHRGDHRWWLAGVAGALTSLLLASLLLSLARQPLPPAATTEPHSTATASPNPLPNRRDISAVARLTP